MPKKSRPAAKAPAAPPRPPLPRVAGAAVPVPSHANGFCGLPQSLAKNR